MKTFFLYVLLAFAWLCGQAQDTRVEDRYNEYFGVKPAGFLSFRNVFHPGDYMLGVEVGMISASRNLTFFGSFDARPYRKKIQVYQGNNVFYQYAEERYFVGAGAEYIKSFIGADKGVFVQLNGNYTWGAYGGTDRKPDKGWVLTPRIGLYWQFAEGGFLKLGYTHLDTKSQLENHRLYLAISGVITRGK